MTISPIPTVNVSNFNTLKNATRTFDLQTVLESALRAYTDPMGSIFWLFLWVMVVVAYWIRTRSLTLPSVIGLAFGGIIIVMLPEEYQLYGRIFITMGIVALIYLIFTKRSD